MSNWPLRQTGGVLSNITFTTADDTRKGITRPTTNHVLGAWTQLIASTPYMAEGFQATIHVNNDDTPRNYIFAFAIGAAGSEIIIVHDLLVRSIMGYRGVHGSYFLPIRVPAGVRFSVACQADNTSLPNSAGQGNPVCAVNLMPASPLFPVGYAGMDVLNVSRATTDLGSVTVTSAYGGGAVAQIVSSTSRTYRGIALSSGSLSDNAVDLYVGASGSEVPLIEKFTGTQTISGGTLGGQQSPVYPIVIPAGSRLSMRAWNPGSGNPILHCYY